LDKLAEAVGTHVGDRLRDIYGSSSALHDGPTRHPSEELVGTVIEQIPKGVSTTIIPVAIPLTTAAPGVHVRALEQVAVLGIVLFALAVWFLPWFCIKRRWCTRWFQRWMSRRLGLYFALALVVNLAFATSVMATLPDLSVNDLFFAFVALVGALSDKLEVVLKQVAILGAMVLAITLRRRIFALLGFDSQIIKADLRDILTCFTMRRFRTIEISLWKVSSLPPSFSSRSLFVRILLGYNEPQHTRPHENCTRSVVIRERVQLNYDPEDDTQRLSLVVKAQEVVSSAVTQMAPPAGLLIGAGVNSFTPIGSTAGAALGVVTAIGAANSLGVEVARVDLSCAMINRLRKQSADGTSADPMATGPSAPWNEEKFVKVDLVPQGDCWLRICDVVEP
jgi:hypothetical protein